MVLHGAWGAVDTDVLSASFPWRSAVHFKIARQHFFKHTVRRFFLNPWWQGRWVTGSQVSASDVSLTGDCSTLLFVFIHLVGRHIVLNTLPSSIFEVVYTDKYVDLVMRFLAKIFDGAVKCSASETASKTLKLHLLTFWFMADCTSFLDLACVSGQFSEGPVSYCAQTPRARKRMSHFKGEVAQILPSFSVTVLWPLILTQTALTLIILRI